MFSLDFSWRQSFHENGKGLVMCYTMFFFFVTQRSSPKRNWRWFWGALRSNDAYGNEKVKETIGLIRKTTTSHARASHFFCTFLYRFYTTTTWKCLISRFIEDVNKQRRNFISLSELGYGHLKFSFRRVRPHLTKYVGRNNRYKDWKNANSLFKQRSRCRRVVGSFKKWTYCNCTSFTWSWCVIAHFFPLWCVMV